MKTSLFFLLSVLMMSQAQASFFQVSCESAENKVSWKEGQMVNEVTLKIVDSKGRQKARKYDRHQVKIVLKNEKTISEKSVADCKVGPVASRTHVYTAKATLTPERGMNVNFGNTRKIEAFVKCTMEMNAMMNCP